MVREHPVEQRRFDSEKVQGGNVWLALAIYRLRSMALNMGTTAMAHALSFAQTVDDLD